MSASHDDCFSSECCTNIRVVHSLTAFEGPTASFHVWSVPFLLPNDMHSVCVHTLAHVCTLTGLYYGSRCLNIIVAVSNVDTRPVHASSEEYFFKNFFSCFQLTVVEMCLLVFLVKEEVCVMIVLVVRVWRV